MTSPVRIPADVDMPDTVLGPLTARQLAILGVTGLVLYAAWSLTRAFLPIPVFVALATPVGAVATILALGRRDGVSLDRLMFAAIRQHLGPHHQVAAPEGVRPAPEWLTTAVNASTTRPGHNSRPAPVQRTGGRTRAVPGREVSPSALRLPAEAVTDTGVVDLGADGLAVVAVASTVNFALRTPAEQEALVASFARYLHSLTAGVQLLVRAQRLDLSGQITELRARAGGLPHPALEAAAIEHADYLAHLGEQTELLRRQVLLVLREPINGATAAPTDGLGGPGPFTVLSSLARRKRRATTPANGVSAGARRAAESRLVRRLGEAIELLAPAGIVVTPLDAGQATAVLASACNPDTLLPPSAALAGADEVITTASGMDLGEDDHGDDAFWPARRAHEPPRPRRARLRQRHRRLGLRRRHRRHPERCRGKGTVVMTTRSRTRRGPHRPATPGAGHNSIHGGAAFTPDALSIGARHIEVGNEWVASFAVTGFPREVHPGWLAPLLTYPGRLDVALHVEPIDPVTAAARLKKQLAKLESGRRHTAEHGRLFDPQVEAATEDAYDLSARVARGEGKLFRVGLYLTVHAPSERALADEVGALRSLCASLLLDAKHTTYRSLQGWVSTLPMGLDLIGMRRTFDTSALSAAFPFTSPDLPAADPTSVAAPSGVLYGYNVGSQGLVHWDRFGEGMHNHNAVILGRSGAGKSYLVKLELLRSLYRGIEVAVVDPEDEYARLATAVGGIYVHLGAREVRFNPFDLPIHTRADGRRTAPKDALVRRSLFLHTVIAVLLGGELGAAERAALDRAIAGTYQSVGITADARTWTRPAPTLRILRDQLAAAGQAGGDPAGELAARLHPFVEGAFKQLFDGPTTTNPQGHVVVFSLRDLPDELKPIGTLLVLDAVWRRVSNPAIRRPRLVVVDEAWLLMQEKSGAEFLFRMAKASRKHWAGLTVCTQDIADVLGSDLGKAVVANAATQILLRQASQAIDEITRTFDLSAGERQFLLSADRGQGLLSAGTQRVAFQSIASPGEDFLATTSPAELAKYATEGETGDAADSEQSYVNLGWADDPTDDHDDVTDTGESGLSVSEDQIELDTA